MNLAFAPNGPTARSHQALVPAVRSSAAIRLAPPRVDAAAPRLTLKWQRRCLRKVPTVTAAVPRLVASALFFPAAALFAAVALPASVLAMLHAPLARTAYPGSLAHAHEMLLGYALAVIAGYQLPRVTPLRLWLLFALWCAARVAFVVPPLHALAPWLNAGFAAALALHIAPRLFRTAKKWRNQALPVFLTATCGVAIAVTLVAGWGGSARAHDLVDAMVLVLGGLMLFMGGRMIAPAVAGEFYRQGTSLVARVQPRIEAVLILATLAAALAELARYDGVMRIACALAGALALVRLARWRLWRCVHRHDLLRLATGYAWLAVGLLAIATAPPGPVRIAALHFVTIGALGSLTLNVMAATTGARRRATRLREPLLDVATALIALAAASRLAAALAATHASAWLGLAAAAWTAAFLILALLLMRDRRLRASAGDEPAPGR